MGLEFYTSKLADAVNWARKYSLFQYPFVTACCGMEFMSLWGPKYDVARFGAEFPRFSPRQADLLVVVGTITERQGPVLRRIYEQMCEPKWTIAFGVCASTGGFYQNYSTMPGCDQVIPVDVYIPGCPPRPEQVLDGLMILQDKIQNGQGRVQIREKAEHDAVHLGKAGGAKKLKGLAVSLAALERAKQILGDAVKSSHSQHGDDTIVVDAAVLIDVMRQLKDDSELSMNFLVDLTAVDYLGREPRFEVVYHLRSFTTGARLRVKAPLAEPEDGSHPSIGSVTPLWGVANWFEREVWDLYGIKFSGHPDLRRILMYEEFVGHPLRKDYPKERRQPLLRRDPNEV